MTTAQNIDDYIAACPTEVRPVLEKIRGTIRKAVPGVEEKISYRIPAFTLGGGVVIYFAAFKNHIGVYPPLRGDARLSKALLRYRGEKGNLKFPFDEPIPYALIGRVAKSLAKARLTGSKQRRT